jgi:hypothetical protein
MTKHTNDDSDLDALEIISNEAPTHIVRRSFVATTGVLVVVIFTCWLIRYPDSIAANVIPDADYLAVDINSINSKHLRTGEAVTLKFGERSIETRIHSIDDNHIVLETREHPSSSHATIITRDLNLLQRSATQIQEMLSFGK